MKRRNALMALVLGLAMIFGTCTSVFAATGPATDVTKQALVDNAVKSIDIIKNEVDVESIAKALAYEVKDGGYELIDTAALKAKIDNKEKVLIIDTMPKDEWWVMRHIPGSVCSQVGIEKPLFIITDAQKKELLQTVKEAVGTKKVTKYYNKKTKKWQKNKIKGAKKKTFTEINKDKEIIVYCGFTKCQRSHQAAKFLTEEGFKKVYRYAGGISAWVDAGYDIEGTDVDPAVQQ